MTCCGQHPGSTRGRRETTPTRPARMDWGEPRFRYVGRTALTVVGGATGRRYRFPRPGFTARVDLRDRASLRRVPVLLEVI